MAMVVCMRGNVFEIYISYIVECMYVRKSSDRCAMCYDAMTNVYLSALIVVRAVYSTRVYYTRWHLKTGSSIFDCKYVISLSISIAFALPWP